MKDKAEVKNKQNKGKKKKKKKTVWEQAAAGSNLKP